jgi:hypothetical protein
MLQTTISLLINTELFSQKAEAVVNLNSTEIIIIIQLCFISKLYYKCKI